MWLSFETVDIVSFLIVYGRPYTIHVMFLRAASNLSRTVNASSEQVMIRVPDSTKSKVVKSLNAPVSQRLLLIGFCDYFGLQPSHMCIECRQPMLMVDHYK